ncbi:hypothetical protein FLB_03680 [Flavobacterium succinicans]|uniref:Uncharacterized protein n=1 Tax=Flavobacterium succinicans TaxID=29536 RepID=A0A199XUA4_9FLAO|nr:hypothetical protein FLB_03680 [Flavobacterium succinicans]
MYFILGVHVNRILFLHDFNISLNRAKVLKISQ